MHSPPVEWTLGIAYLAILDYIRNQGDPDGDTLTEVLREAFGVDTRAGRVGLGCAIAAGGAGLYLHLVKPSMR